MFSCLFEGFFFVGGGGNSLLFCIIVLHLCNAVLVSHEIAAGWPHKPVAFNHVIVCWVLTALKKYQSPGYGVI